MPFLLTYIDVKTVKFSCLLNPDLSIQISSTPAICKEMCGDAVASWLVQSSPDQAVWVRALARDIVLCSWARHFTLIVPVSTQVYKWVPVNCWGNLLIPLI